MANYITNQFRDSELIKNPALRAIVPIRHIRQYSIKSALYSIMTLFFVRPLLLFIFTSPVLYYYDAIHKHSAGKQRLRKLILIPLGIWALPGLAIKALDFFIQGLVYIIPLQFIWGKQNTTYLEDIKVNQSIPSAKQAITEGNAEKLEEILHGDDQNTSLILANDQVNQSILSAKQAITEGNAEKLEVILYNDDQNTSLILAEDDYKNLMGMVYEAKLNPAQECGIFDLLLDHMPKNLSFDAYSSIVNCIIYQLSLRKLTDNDSHIIQLLLNSSESYIKNMRDWSNIYMQRIFVLMSLPNDDTSTRNDIVHLMLTHFDFAELKRDNYRDEELIETIFNIVLERAETQGQHDLCSKLLAHGNCPEACKQSDNKNKCLNHQWRSSSAIPEKSRNRNSPQLAQNQKRRGSCPTMPKR